MGESATARVSIESGLTKEVGNNRHGSKCPLQCFNEETVAILGDSEQGVEWRGSTQPERSSKISGFTRSFRPPG
jgi:hypothetical protein